MKKNFIPTEMGTVMLTFVKRAGLVEIALTPAIPDEVTGDLVHRQFFDVEESCEHGFERCIYDHGGDTCSVCNFPLY